MSYNVASLFAGVGGICQGFKEAGGYNLKVANEMDPDACITYKTNFSHDLAEGDIEKILNPDFVKLEREYLLNKKTKLEKKCDFSKTYDPEFVEECIRKLYKNFLPKSLKNSFDFTPGLKKKINEQNIDVNEFKKFIEYELALTLLGKITDDYVDEKINYYNREQEKLLKHKIDVLTAGFPCQAFSVAGERKGFDDHRGELFYSVIKLVRQLDEIHQEKPRVILLENVKNLEKHDNGNTYKTIINEIHALGYKTDSAVLNTCKHSYLPQNRERIFIVCFLHEKDYEAFKGLDVIKKEKEKQYELRDADHLKKEVEKIIDKNISFETDSRYYYTPEKFPHYFRKEGEEIPEGKQRVNLEEQITEEYTFYQLRRGQYVRKNKSFVCPTLTADMGGGGHNVPLIKVKDGIRKLTPKECFRLQGFKVEESYHFPKPEKNIALYKQAGNSVSVDIIKTIAEEIKKALDKSSH